MNIESGKPEAASDTPNHGLEIRDLIKLGMIALGTVVALGFSHYAEYREEQLAYAEGL